MPVTVTTWNLKGSERPDTGVVVDHARAVGADVLCLQEVQCHQARAIARGLAAASLRWGFKHWPVRTWPEGMAIVGVTWPVAARCHALTHRWRLWSWQRRILLTGTLLLPPVAGETATALRLIDLHLSPHGTPGLRDREVDAVLRLVATADRRTAVADRRPRPLIVAGDLNDGPAAAFFERLGAAGLRDAWSLAHPGVPEARAATNWSGTRAGDPRRRLDYVLVSEGTDVLEVSVPRPSDPGFERFRTLSDHLPVTATVDL